MSSVDNRVVNMEFNNSEFKKKAKETAESLNEIDAAAEKAGRGEGLLEVDKNMSKVTATATKMTVASTAFISTLVSRATGGVLNLLKNTMASTVDTIMVSGKARALAIEQAKFQFRGLGLDVTKTMQSAREAVLGTAYGLQDAASVAAQFAGAGMKAGKQMTAALRSISGMAAQTGRSYSEIGQVMTGIAGVGRVTSQDLIQFGTRGLNVASAMALSLIHI